MRVDLLRKAECADPAKCGVLLWFFEVTCDALEKVRAAQVSQLPRYYESYAVISGQELGIHLAELKK